MSMVPPRIATTSMGPASRGRFAPSPTGDLHLGSLVAALGSWLRARSQGGTWIVRMEDIDASRTIPGAGERILATLSAFGFESDEHVVWQSNRLDLYESAFQSLKARALVYPCHCSRSDLAALNGIHPRQCVRHDRGGAPAWRVRVDEKTITFADRMYGSMSQRPHAEFGDFLIRRADGSFCYQLAVVVDDGDQEISDVVRGADLLDSTARQIFLQGLLGLPTPGYMHLPLALDAKGRKLSKQDRARPVDIADPLPALRAALDILGQKRTSGTTAREVLREAMQTFNIDAIPVRSAKHAAMRKD